MFNVGVEASVVFLAGAAYIGKTYSVVVLLCAPEFVFSCGGHLVEAVFQIDENEVVSACYGQPHAALLLGELAARFKGVVQKI